MILATQRNDPLLDALSHLPTTAILIGEEVGAGHAKDMSVIEGARPQIVLRPKTTAEVSTMLAACHALRRPIAVQGGRTGLAGGASPKAGEVALSLERMRAINDVDVVSATVMCEAGVPLEQVQTASAAYALRLPVDFGARGTATVGGMIATNAGGIRVVGHGMTRRHVLGLEAVVADGTIVSRLGTLAKDNSGPDLKHLFIGTEGILGVITRATLALSPEPAFTALAFCALPDTQSALETFRLVRGGLGQRLSAFEFIEGRVHTATCDFGADSPVSTGASIYAMIEIEGATTADRALFEDVLAEALDAQLITDASIAQNQREQAAFWRFRDTISECIFAMTDTYGFDIGVPLAHLDRFLVEAEDAILKVDRNARPWIFGHLGDGNLHYIVTTTQPDAVAGIVYRRVAALGGALSAEHGIGREKTRWLPMFRSSGEIEQMRLLKATFDPHGILNPGRVLPAGVPQ